MQTSLTLKGQMLCTENFNSTLYKKILATTLCEKVCQWLATVASQIANSQITESN
jgi:hypothetical protein